MKRNKDMSNYKDKNITLKGDLLNWYLLNQPYDEKNKIVNTDIPHLKKILLEEFE